MSIKIAILGAGWLGLPLSEHLSQIGLNCSLIKTQELKNITNWDEYEIFISTWPKENLEAFKFLPRDCKIIAMSSTSQTDSIIQFENELKSLFSKLTILRLGGLIGYTRHPGKFLAGKKQITGKNHFINLIHRDDIIQIISELLSQNKMPHETLSLVCDSPAKKKDFYTFAANEIGQTLPEFDELDNSEKPAVDGAAIKKLINYEFIYSSPFDYLRALRERKNNRT
jgi:hypothetical protein